MITKIIIVGMNYIGDTIFITPLIRAIKKHYSDSVIDVINGEKGIDILKNNPYINNIIVKPKNNIKSIIKDIRKYDIGFAATTALYGAYILYKAKIPIRAGVNSEMRGIFLTHKTPWKKHSRHIIDTILSPLPLLNIEIDGTNTEIFLTENELEFGKEKMKSFNKPLIVHGGATRISKRYPVENFAKLINMFYDKTNTDIILVGSKDDIEFSKKMKSMLGKKIAADFTGEISIRELISVIKNSYAFIGGDSAPLHIANAMGIYTLGIYGDTKPIVYGVRGDKAINVEGRKYCRNIKSFHCEYIKRGCKSIECLKNLKPEYILPYLLSFYK